MPRSTRREKPTGVQKQCILIIDDNPYFAEILRDVLAAEGYAVFLAADHQNINAMITAKRPSLIISDDNIEHSQTYAAGEAWCQSYKESGGALPVILVTSAPLSTQGMLALQDSSLADFVIPKTTIEGPQGMKLLLQYIKDLAPPSENIRYSV
ncbi:MAG: response regulator [Rickettsiales bacterium]|nr:response regulator [Rickettsiales bacterium]